MGVAPSIMSDRADVSPPEAETTDVAAARLVGGDEVRSLGEHQWGLMSYGFR